MISARIRGCLCFGGNPPCLWLTQDPKLAHGTCPFSLQSAKVVLLTKISGIDIICCFFASFQGSNSPQESMSSLELSKSDEPPCLGPQSGLLSSYATCSTQFSLSGSLSPWVRSRVTGELNIMCAESTGMLGTGEAFAQ